MAIASEQETFLADRRLYTPRGGISARRQGGEANVPDTIEYRDKAELGLEMLRAAKAKGLEASWVFGDSIYGRDRDLRRAPEESHQAYVLTTSSNAYLWRGFKQ